MFGAIDPDEKPEILCTNREPVFTMFSLDQLHRTFKRNLFGIENEEKSKWYNSNFACFVQLTF